MTTNKNAALPLPLTDTRCHLLHNSKEVTSYVILSTLDPSKDVFTVAPIEDPRDPSLSFTVARDGIGIILHEPCDLVVESKPALEVNLPRMSIKSRDATGKETVVYRFDSGKDLGAPVPVTRSGSDTDLIIGINLDGSTTTALPPPDGSYCVVSWYVNSKPRSLRFAAAAAPTGSSGVPLILKPKRQE